MELSTWIVGEMKESEYRNRVQRAVENVAKSGVFKEIECHCGSCLAMTIAKETVALSLMDWAEGAASRPISYAITSSIPNCVIAAYVKRILTIEGIDYSSMPFDLDRMRADVADKERESIEKEGPYDMLESITSSLAAEIYKTARQMQEGSFPNRAMRNQGGPMPLSEILRRMGM